jgi:hypothetical protein
MSACRSAALATLLLAACQEGGVGRLSRALGDERPAYRLLALEEPLAEGRRAALEAGGIRLLVRRGGGEWLARGTAGAFAELGGDARTAGAREKLDARLRERARLEPGAELALRALLAYDLVDDERARAEAEEELRALAPDLRRVGFLPLYALTLPAALLEQVARLEAVRWLELAPGPARPLLDGTRVVIGAEALHALDPAASPPSYGLAGQGTVGAIWDPHGIDPEHPDLKPQLLRHTDPKLAKSLFHGTAVGGCLAGSGAASAQPPHPWSPYQLRGIAPAARLVTYITDGDRDASGKETQFPEQYLEARTVHGADVVSLSFSHDLQAVYDSTAANLDQLIARAGQGLPEPVPVLVAAGNEGWKLGYGSVTSLASAKNVIAVGASDRTDGRMVGFSSFGPTEDGRLKPELMAPGCASHGATALGLDRIRLLAASGAVVKEWGFATDAEGWTALQDLAPPTVAAGVLESKTTGGDPALQSAAGLALPAASIAVVEVTMRVGHHHQAELFWATDKAPVFAASRRQGFPVNADGTLHTYAVKVAGHAEWKDTIARLRLDPIASPGIALPVPGGSYGTSCGTSMSTPITAGAVLLLVQAWRELVASASARPSPALVKALLVASARDLVGQGPGQNPDLGGAQTPYPAGPDFATGFGELDVGRAVALLRGVPRPHLEAELPYAGRRVGVRLRLLEMSAAPIRVTLAWDDPPGEPASKATLQNDLDLGVRTPAGQTLLPSTLAAKLPSQAALRQLDSVNNLEQVTIPDAGPGDYRIEVVGRELARPPQRFALVVSGEGALAVAPLVLDADGDGSYTGDDCDDTRAEVHPGAEELPGNGRDDDCDPATPDEPAPAPDARAPGDAGAPRLDAAGDGGAPAAGDGCGCGLEQRAPSAGLGLLAALLLIALTAISSSRRRCRRPRRRRPPARSR